MILSTRRLGLPLDPETRAWVTGLSPQMTQRLARLGVLEEAPQATLAALLDYASRTVQVNSSTQKIHAKVKRNLLTFFGPDRLIGSVSRGDAQEFLVWLSQHGAVKGEPLSTATVESRFRQAGQFFAAAVAKQWLPVNPFAGIRPPKPDLAARRVWVPQESIRSLADDLDDDSYLVAVLARFGGLRVPSEVLPLDWADIDWEGGTLRVTCQKTARHPHCRIRMIPLFPDVREVLSRRWQHESKGQIIDDPTMTGPTVYHRVKRALRSRGIIPWPKLFQNMRSSRETELNDRFPSHVVAGWIGHSSRVAEQHYLQVTEEHLRLAVEEGEVKSEASRRRHRVPKSLPGRKSIRISQEIVTESARK